MPTFGDNVPDGTLRRYGRGSEEVVPGPVEG